MTVDSKKKMAEENSVINLLPRTFAKYKWWFLVSGVPGKEEMLRNLTGETSLGKLLPTYPAKQLPRSQQKLKAQNIGVRGSVNVRVTRGI